VSNVAITLPESVVQRAMKMTGKRTPRAAVIAALSDQGNSPNAETLRALREPVRGKTFDSGKAAIAYLRERYKR
jgi:Arc/MetJ family transcription regulator